MKTLAEFWPLILATLGLAGAGAGGVLLARLAWVRAFLDRLKLERRAVVLEVEQTYVDRVREARDPFSPGGVELTEDEQREALLLAVSRLKSALGVSAIERALRILGLPRLPEFVDRWLTTHVEAEVKTLTIAQRGVKR